MKHVQKISVACISVLVIITITILVSGCGSDDNRNTLLIGALFLQGGGVTISCDPGENIGKPDASNTGYSGTLSVYSGDTTIEVDDTVIEDVSITGALYIDADNVTVRNFDLNANGDHYGIRIVDGHSGIVIERGEIYNMNSAGILGMGFTARRLRIHESGGDGVKVQGAGGEVKFYSSYIYNLGTAADAHADGNQTRGGAHIAFCYNTIDIPAVGSANYQGAPYKSNATFILELDVSDFLIEGNWLNGGNYTIYGQSGTAVRGNRFGRDYSFNVATGAFDVWEHNVWDDTGEDCPCAWSGCP